MEIKVFTGCLLLTVLWTVGLSWPILASGGSPCPRLVVAWGETFALPLQGSLPCIFPFGYLLIKLVLRLRALWVTRIIPTQDLCLIISAKVLFPNKFIITDF